MSTISSGLKREDKICPLLLGMVPLSCHHRALMGNPTIPYTQSYLPPSMAEAMADVVREGRLVMGHRVAQFEQSIAEFTGRKHAIAVTSGTSALELALRTHDIGPDFHVFVPAYTWVATYNVPLLLGARPVLVDVDPATFCMDPKALELARAQFPGARHVLMPVHLFGYRALGGMIDKKHDGQREIVIGDGCCAFGGLDQGAMCGAWSPVECLSFHPRKVITTGEGGMVLCDDDVLAARMRRLRDHGAERSAEQRAQTTRGGPMTPHFPEPGLNLRMTEMQGALGVEQMKALDLILAGRRRVAAKYDELLRDGPSWLLPPPGSDDPGRLLTFYVARIVEDRSDPQRKYDESRLVTLEEFRNALLLDLAEAGIVARPPMISLLEAPFTAASRGEEQQGFPGTRTLNQTAFALPFYPMLSDADIERVVEAVVRFGSRRWTH
jgi:perosamine synthetase